VATETRSMDVYALVFARPDRRFGPNLKRSAPECITARADRKPLPQKCRASIDQFKPGFSRPTSTISEFVTALRRTIGASLNGPIVDRTGLDGLYDISIWYAPNELTVGDPPTDKAAIDSALLIETQSLMSALPGQLGLKLERRRDSVEVLVIESASLPLLD